MREGSRGDRDATAAMAATDRGPPVRAGGMEGFGMTRHGLLAAVVALFLVLAQVATAAAAPAGQAIAGGRAASAAPIDRDLQRDLSAGTATKILVEFDAKANLGAARKIKERVKRGDAVVNALKATA